MQDFWLHEPEPDDPDKEKDKLLRVWEKSTQNHEISCVRRIKDEDLPMGPLPPGLEAKLAMEKAEVMKEEIPDATFLTQVAGGTSGLAEPLKKSEKDIRTYVQKKREVFLVHMACDVKKAEIVRLDDETRAKEEALARSQEMLDEDAKRFESFMQEKMTRAQTGTREAEAWTKRKQEKLQKIKTMRQQIASGSSEMAKQREVFDELTKYKHFLDRLTPDDYKEEQRQIKLARKAKRKERWIKERMAPILQRLAEEEQRQPSAEEEAEQRAKRRGRSKRKEQEEAEEAQRLQKERDARRKKLLQQKQEEERRWKAAYVDVSSEEDMPMYFKDPHMLLDAFTSLEERNLFLIQHSQETEQSLDEIHHTFECTKRDLGGKVKQLKDTINHLEQSIAQASRRADDLRKSYVEKAGTEVQDGKLAALSSKVIDLYRRFGLPLDHNPEPLSMLATIEKKIEDLIRVLDEAYLQDSELVLRLEKDKERERRERVKEFRLKEQTDKQEERLKNSLLRSQAPVFKKAGKQVMYRSPPLHREQKVVQDNGDEEAQAQEHKVFAVYIDRKTNVAQTDLPVPEDPRRGAPTQVSSSSSRQ